MPSAELIHALVELNKAKINVAVARFHADILSGHGNRAEEAIDSVTTLRELVQEALALRRELTPDALRAAAATSAWPRCVIGSLEMAQSLPRFLGAYEEITRLYGGLLSDKDRQAVKDYVAWVGQLPEQLSAYSERQRTIRRGKLSVSTLPKIDLGRPVQPTTYSREELYGEDGR